MLIAGTMTYEPTPDDVLWLLRAVAAEGPPQDRVAETLINGFMWARSEGLWGSKRSLADWVRAYAQPVNPLWYPGGDKVRESIEATPHLEVDILRKAAVRRDVHSTRTAFTESTRNAVMQALQREPAYRGATDYAAPWVAKPAPWLAITESKPGENRFWQRPSARGWSGYLVRNSAGSLVALALACAAILYLVWGRA